MNVLVIIAAVAVFLLIVTVLVLALLAAEAKLVQKGKVKIIINDNEDEPVETEAGGTLLNTLSSNGILLPSACGGGGTCGVCRCRVLEGGGDLLPTEESHISRREAKEDWRLSCQVKVKQDMRIEVPPEVFSIEKWECEVISNRNVASFIKEFVVALPEGKTLDFKAGGYIQIEVPPYELDYRDIEVDERFRSEWDRMQMWDLSVRNVEPVVRAYSMASYPAENDRIILNVRVATPPWDREKNQWMDVPPGIASSYIFGCKPGDRVTISGPYGEFFIQDTDREMVYIGGGAGMAPLRSHIFHLFKTLKTSRKVSYWYGARSLREMFYWDDFREIEEEFDNFTFHVALSEPLPEDNWDGPTGFIHQVVLDNYLSQHPAPEDIEYYLCGPPVMNDAVQNMLYNLGVEEDMIRFDDFGV